MGPLREAIDDLSPARRRLLAAWLATDGGGVPAARPDRRRLIAHVVPNHAALHADATEQDRGPDGQLQAWREVYDAFYAAPRPAMDPAFDTTGWVDSVTSEPIPAEEMEEWLGHTVERILRLRPRHVLEIGCGTGLVLFRVAPHVELYCATDFSRVAVDRLRGTCPLAGVSLHERQAHDLQGLPGAPYDLVILNSVIQYFPGLKYLQSVLASVLPRVVPGGHIFIGDVRNKTLLEAFHLAVELPRSAPASHPRRLLERIGGRSAYEQELVVDPAFFHALPTALPGIGAVEVEPKRGRGRNELTRFRYDVVLRAGPSTEPSPLPRTISWRSDEWTPERFRTWLSTETPETVAVLNVPSERVLKEVRALDLLAGPDEFRTVADLDARASELAREAVCVEDLAAPGYDVHLRWSERPGCLDVIVRRGAPQPCFEARPRSDARLSAHVNMPVMGMLMRRLVPTLRRHLQEGLPDYMVPSAVVLLDALPRLPNGKTDRRALPIPFDRRAHTESRYVAPRTPLEEQLAALWSEILTIRRVGINDNFFDLGGHSLLATQLISRVRRKLNVEVPLRTLFEQPTVAAQAAVIEALLLAEIDALSDEAAERLARD